MKIEARDVGERPVQLALRDGLERDDERERALVAVRCLENRVDVDGVIRESAADAGDDPRPVRNDEPQVERRD